MRSLQAGEPQSERKSEVNRGSDPSFQDIEAYNTTFSCQFPLNKGYTPLSLRDALCCEGER
ncbi:hypothetical protein I4100191B2_03560 [Clostridiales bacterium]